MVFEQQTARYEIILVALYGRRLLRVPKELLIFHLPRGLVGKTRWHFTPSEVQAGVTCTGVIDPQG